MLADVVTLLTLGANGLDEWHVVPPPCAVDALKEAAGAGTGVSTGAGNSGYVGQFRRDRLRPERGAQNPNKPIA